MDKITTKALIVFFLLIVFVILFTVFSRSHAQDKGPFLSNIWTVGNEIVVIEYQDEQGNTYIQVRNRNPRKRQNENDNDVRDEDGLGSLQKRASDLMKDYRWQNCPPGACAAEESIQLLLGELAGAINHDGLLKIFLDLIGYEIRQKKVRSLSAELFYLRNFLWGRATQAEKIDALYVLKILSKEEWTFEDNTGDRNTMKSLINELETDFK